MRLQWAAKALDDLVRLHGFLAGKDPHAAACVIQGLTQAPETLLGTPRLGERLSAFDPREVRRILVGAYEMRYEVQPGVVTVLRVWHTREDR